MNNLKAMTPDIAGAGAARPADLPASLGPKAVLEAFDSHLPVEKKTGLSPAKARPGAETTRRKAALPDAPLAEKRAVKNDKGKTEPNEPTGAEVNSTSMVDLRVQPLALPPVDQKLAPARSDSPNPLPAPSRSQVAGSETASAKSASSMPGDSAAPGADPVETAASEAAKTSPDTKPAPRSDRPAEETHAAFSSENKLFTNLTRPSGTDAAKQHVVMSKAELETRTNSSQPAGPGSPQQVDVAVSRVVRTSEDQNFSSDKRPTDSGLPGKANTLPALPASAAATTSNTPMVDRPEKLSRTEQVTRVFNVVTEAAERLRSDGHTNVEMQIKLRDGEQITIKLQLHAGEMRVVFKTESREWREAITRGWSAFTSNSAERGLRTIAPVFESATAQNETPDFNGRRQDDSDQSNEMRRDNSLTLPAGTKRRPGTPSTASPAPAGSPLPHAPMPKRGLATWA